MFDGVAEPTRPAVAEAASAALDREVASVHPFTEGMNAVYRVTLANGERLVLKAATSQDGPELLSGPLILDRVARETDVPVPEVRTVVSAVESHLECAFYLMEYVEGRRIQDVRNLSPGFHERLAREAGRHLAAIHALQIDGPYGRRVAEGGELAVDYPFEEWAPNFRSELEYALDGEAKCVTGAEDAVRGALDALEGTAVARDTDTSLLYRDYHPKNLVFAPDDGADPAVRAVLDFNYRPVGDAPLDVAIAEWHLIDVPFGGTSRAGELRNTLRGAYAEARGGDLADYFGSWYACYRLIPALGTLNYFDYFSQFAPEDRDGFADRIDAFLRARIDEGV